MRSLVLGALQLGAGALIVVSLSGLAPSFLPSTGFLFAALLGLLAWSALLDATAGRGLGPGVRDFVRSHAFELSLAVLSLAALGVRLAGLGLGIGHEASDIDERRLATSVMTFFKTGELNHLTSEDHPGLHFWCLAAGSLVAYLWALMRGLVTDVDQASVDLFVLAGRATNAVLGAATVLLTGVLGRGLAGDASGLVAAVLVAIVPLAVDTSTLLRNDVGLAFFVVACACLAQHALASGRSRPALLAGVLAGCATAVKATGIFTLLAASLAALLGARGRGRAAHLALALAGFVLAVAVTNHFVWADFPNFVRQLSTDFGHVQAGHFAATPNPRLAYVSTLAEEAVGWPLVALAGAVLAVALARREARAWVFWSFPLAYLWFMTGKPALFPRWVYPLVPFAAIGGAQGLAFVTRGLARLPGRAGRLAAAGVAIAVLAPALWPGIVGISRRFPPPTYALAEAWLLAQRAPGDRVLTGPNMLPGVKPEALGGRRLSALKQVLDGGGRYQLYAYPWIVVPETLFEHPRLAELHLASAFYARRGFGGNRGADLKIYAPPPFEPMAPGRIDLDAKGADDFLGFEWTREPGAAGRAVPVEGGSVFLPIRVEDGTRLELEAMLPAAGESPAASGLKLSVEGVATPLSAGPVVGGHVVLRSAPLPAAVRARAARVLVVRLEASGPLRLLALSALN